VCSDPIVTKSKKPTRAATALSPTGTKCVLKQSLVSGLGVFVTHDVEEDTRVTEFTGYVCNQTVLDQCISNYDRRYVIALYSGLPPLSERLYIVGIPTKYPAPPRTPLGHMVNDYRGSTFQHNVRFSLTTRPMRGAARPGIKTNRRIWIRTTRAVEAGCELLANYTEGYWRWHGTQRRWQIFAHTCPHL